MTGLPTNNSILLVHADPFNIKTHPVQLSVRNGRFLGRYQSPPNAWNCAGSQAAFEAKPAEICACMRVTVRHAQALSSNERKCTPHVHTYDAQKGPSSKPRQSSLKTSTQQFKSVLTKCTASSVQYLVHMLLIHAPSAKERLVSD